MTVAKKTESYEPDSIFNGDDDDVSTSDVPSIFEVGSPSPMTPIVVHKEEADAEKKEEEVKLNKTNYVIDERLDVENTDKLEKDEVKEYEIVEEGQEIVEEGQEIVEEGQENEEKGPENENTLENRSDSLNMQEIYLISKESNSLFEGLLENNENDDGNDDEEYDVTTNTTTDDTRRTVEWGSAFTSGSSRVSQLEAENKTLRRRLVMTASKVRSLEVELALANSKKVKRKRQTTFDSSKRDVLEEVCKRLLGSGFHQSRVRQALRVCIVRVCSLEIDV